MKRVLIAMTLLAMVFGIAAFQCSSTELTSAKLYIQQENYDKAKEVLVKEVTNNPQSDEGFYLLGYLNGEEGDYEAMVENYAKSLEISNKFQQEIIDSRQYHWAQNFNKGVGYFNKASQATNEDTTAMFFNDAIQAFENAILVQPDSSSTYKNLTYAYINAGRTDEAIKPLETLIATNATPDAYTMLGDIYFKQGSQEMMDYRTSGNAQDSVAAMETFNKSIKVLEEGKAAYPKNNDILLLLSNAYISANKTDVAMEAFREGVEREPENKFYRYNYGVMLLSANEYEKAVNQFEAALDVDPEYENALYNAGASYVKWGAEIREAAELEENVSDAYKAKFEAALPYLEKYLDYNPEDARVWDLLGRVYANLGMQDKSMNAFEKADEYR